MSRLISLFKINVLIALALSFSMFSLQAQAEPDFSLAPEWQEFSDDGKIQIYTRFLDGKSLRAFRVVTIVDAPLPQVLMFVNDTEQLSRWVFMLDHSRIIADTNDKGISYNYMVSKIPWPIKNRDVVVRSIITYNEVDDEVIITTESEPDYMEENDSYVRIRESASKWRINRFKDGRLRLELTSHAEPGGVIPKWLSNMMVTKLPQHMFKRLPPILESEEVLNMEFDEVKIFGRKGVLKPFEVMAEEPEAISQVTSQPMSKSMPKLESDIAPAEVKAK